MKKVLLQLVFLSLTFLVNAHADTQKSSLSCVYQDKNNQGSNMMHEHCGTLDETGVLILDEKHLHNMAFDADGLSCIYVYGFKQELSHVQYVKQDGKSIKALFFDNGCDYFRQGVARTIRNNKMAYFNKRLNIVIHTSFDFAFPFSNNFAVVCNKPRISNESEHSLIESDQCGLIDQKGHVVLEPIYQSDDWATFDKARERLNAKKPEN